MYILFFTKGGQLINHFKIILYVFAHARSSVCVGREGRKEDCLRRSCLGLKGNFCLISVFISYSTQSLSDKKYMISVWVLTHIKRKQLIKRFSNSVGLMGLSPRPPAWALPPHHAFLGGGQFKDT